MSNITPTTAGTGTEATRNAVLDVPEHGVKVSLGAPTCSPAWPSSIPS